MGTALTERQLERAWRVAHCPVLLFDGDTAGRKAALRAAERAMPFVGPGKSLAIAQLPDGEDPDSLARSAGATRSKRRSPPRCRSPTGCSRRCWPGRMTLLHPRSPRGLWKRLAALAGVIQDGETKAQYLADWRARFDQGVSPCTPRPQRRRHASRWKAGDRFRPGGEGRATVKVGRGGLAAPNARMGAGNAGKGRALGLGRRRRVTAGLIDEAAAEEALDMSKHCAEAT
jgi:DNA primase